MGNKINRLADRLRQSIGVRDAMALIAYDNCLAGRLGDKFDSQVKEMVHSIIGKVTEIQGGASLRGLTLSPVNGMRMPARAVSAFLAEVYSSNQPVTEFAFYADDGEIIELDEMEIEWLYGRLHVDALALASDELTPPEPHTISPISVSKSQIISDYVDEFSTLNAPTVSPLELFGYPIKK